MVIHFATVLFLLTTFILLCKFPGSLGGNIHTLSCYEPYYTIGSTFESNLQQFLTGFPLNNYFYSATYGEAPDKVYGLTMCYADVSSEECNICLSEARVYMPCASNEKNGIVWYDGCIIRYSDAPLNASDYHRMSICVSKGPSSKPKKLTETTTLKNILWQLTVSLAANASRSHLRLAAGKANYTLSASMYVLVQCTRLLTSDECGMCIDNLMDYALRSCIEDLEENTVRPDVIFETVNCYGRFALKPFYVIPEAQPPWSNSSIDSGKSTREPISAYMFTIVIGCLLVLVSGVPL